MKNNSYTASRDNRGAFFPRVGGAGKRCDKQVNATLLLRSIAHTNQVTYIYLLPTIDKTKFRADLAL